MERREQREGEAVLSFWVPSLKERRIHRHRKYGPPSKRKISHKRLSAACFNYTRRDFNLCVIHLCDALVGVHW